MVVPVCVVEHRASNTHGSGSGGLPSFLSCQRWIAQFICDDVTHSRYCRHIHLERYSSSFPRYLHLCQVLVFSSLALLSHAPVTPLIQPPFQDDIVDAMVCRSLVVFSTFGVIVSLSSHHPVLGTPSRALVYPTYHPCSTNIGRIASRVSTSGIVDQLGFDAGVFIPPGSSLTISLVSHQRRATVKNVLRCGHSRCDEPQYLMIGINTDPLTISTQAQAGQTTVLAYVAAAS